MESRLVYAVTEKFGAGFSVSGGACLGAGYFCASPRRNAWLAVLFTVILAVPAASFAWLKFRSHTSNASSAGSERWRFLFFSFQGVALAFWMFDIATTIYAINISGLAYELNPLGWPLGVLGAFAFYGPALVFSYVLLFRFKDRLSFWAAVPLTVLTLGMGAQNLLAGTQNFEVFVGSAALATQTSMVLLAAACAASLCLFALKKAPKQPQVTLKH